MAQHDTVDLSVEEQKAIILYALIQSKHAVKQYSLAQEIGVSVQSLTKLLDDLRMISLAINLTFIASVVKGYILMAPNQRNVSS